MNFKFCSIILIVLSFVITSCSDNIEEAEVNLNFTLTYNDSPLVAFENLDYDGSYKVFFTKYSLFLSEINLHSESGVVPLSDVEFIDLLTGVNSEQEAMNGKTLSYTNIPVGDYERISFNIGVPSAVNMTSPADYEFGNPLSNNAEYWVGWSSYIFHKIEGKMDTDNDGEPEAGIALHIGSDQAFRPVQKNVSIKIDDEIETISINFDLAKILEGDSGFYDFMETPQVHHLGVLPKVLPILDRTMSNLTIEQQ